MILGGTEGEQCATGGGRLGFGNPGREHRGHCQQKASKCLLTAVEEPRLWGEGVFFRMVEIEYVQGFRRIVSPSC